MYFLLLSLNYLSNFKLPEIVEKNEENLMTRVPLFIEFKGKKVLIIGAGSTGCKRAFKFLNAGADVIVASLNFNKTLMNIQVENTRLNLVKLNVSEDNKLLLRLIKWADLIVLALPSKELVTKLRSTCREYKKLINDSTDALETEVVVPFEASIDGVRIAITTEGKSSIVARRLLQKVINYLENDPEFKNVTATWFKIKEIIKNEISDPKLRMKIYSILDKDEEFNNLVKEGKVQEAINYVYNLIKSDYKPVNSIYGNKY